MRKDNFATLLKQAVDSTNLAEVVQNGLTCDLWPFSADAVNYNILNKNKKQEKVPKEQSEHFKIIDINSYEEDCNNTYNFLKSTLVMIY